MLLGCGGTTTGEVPRGEAPAAGSPSGGSAGSSPQAAAGGGSVGSGGVDAMPDPNLTPGGFPRCGALDPARANDCTGIELITPMDPDVSSSVDGSIQVGESRSVSVWIKNGDAIDHDDVCVGVSVETPGITLSDEAPNPSKVGGMYAGGIFTVSPAYFSVGKIESGNIAHFTIWTTYQGTNCLGPTTTAEALVRPYR